MGDLFKQDLKGGDKKGKWIAESYIVGRETRPPHHDSIKGDSAARVRVNLGLFLPQLKGNFLLGFHQSNSAITCENLENFS